MDDNCGGGSVLSLPVYILWLAADELVGLVGHELVDHGLSQGTNNQHRPRSRTFGLGTVHNLAPQFFCLSHPAFLSMLIQILQLTLRIWMKSLKSGCGYKTLLTRIRVLPSHVADPHHFDTDPDLKYRYSLRYSRKSCDTFSWVVKIILERYSQYFCQTVGPWIKEAEWTRIRIFETLR